MTMVTSSSRISPSVRSLSRSRPRRSSPCEPAGGSRPRARRCAMSSVEIASRRCRVERNRRLVGVGAHAAVGRIDRPNRTTSFAASVVASSNCCACPDRSAENSARPTASRPMRCVSAATSTTVPLAKESPSSRALMAVSAAARTWSPTASSRWWWKAGAASRRCSIQLGSDDASNPGPVTRASAAYCTVCLPQCRAEVCSTCRTSAGSLTSSAGAPGTGKATRSPKRSETSTRKLSGSARTDRKASAMSRGLGPGTPTSVGLIACSRAGVLTRPPRRSGGPATPTPHRSSARGRSRIPGPPPARRRAGLPLRTSRGRCR